jgi:hypothetical protein
MALTTKDLQDQLTRYFNGDIARVKTMAKGCNAIGFKMSEHLEEISKNPESFMVLITYSDLGILGKLADSLELLKKGK